jgi:hypothetical protein
MRCNDPEVTRSVLDRAIGEYEKHYSGLIEYGVHLRWWIARYSRGDSLEALREAFGIVAHKVQETGELERSRFGAGYRSFGYRPTDIERFRTALVLLSIGLCLRSPPVQIRNVLDWCERGDPLLEAIAHAALPSETPPQALPAAFPQEFDGLYAALAAAPSRRAALIADYLSVWLDSRMNGFGFKVGERKIGYWCFEAAGLVATFNIDDDSFASRPHYPRDLPAYYRAAGASDRMTP